MSYYFIALAKLHKHLFLSQRKRFRSKILCHKRNLILKNSMDWCKINGCYRIWILKSGNPGSKKKQGMKVQHMVFLCCNFKLFLCNDLTIVRFRFFPPSKNSQHQFLSKIQYEKSTVLKYRLQKKNSFSLFFEYDFILLSWVHRSYCCKSKWKWRIFFKEIYGVFKILTVPFR